jgi:hypothetical protein
MNVRHFFFLLLVIFTSLGLGGASFAQSTPRAIANPQLQMLGARSQSLGGLNPTLFGEINSVMANPASMGSTDVMPVAISSQRLINDFDYFLINTAYEFEVPYSLQGRLKQNVAVGFSYGSLMSYGVPITRLDKDSSTGNTIRSDGTGKAGFDVLYLSGSSDFYDLWAFNILSVGAGFKMVRQTIGSDSRAALGLDLGGIGTYQFSDLPIERLHLGLSIHNFLSTNMVWNTQHPVTGETITDEAFLPLQLYLGVRADMLDDQLSLFLHNALEGLTVGAEYWLQSSMALRASTNFRQLNLGTGLLFENVVTGFDERGYGMRLDANYTQNVAPLDGNPNVNFSVSILGESRPKTPQIFSPLKELTTRERDVRLAGLGPKNTTIRIYNNKSISRTVKTDRYGNWQFGRFPIKEGKNLIYVSAYSIEQQAAAFSDPVIVTSDTEPPSLNVKIYPEGKDVVVVVEPSEELVELSAVYQDRNIPFKKNGATWVARGPLPSVFYNNSPIPDAFRSISVSAIDKAGNKSENNLYNFFIALTSPADKTVHYRDEIRAVGSLSKNIRGLLINDVAGYVDAKNNFALSVRLKPGKNLIKVVLKPIAGDDLIYQNRVLRLITFNDLTKQTKEKREIEFLATLGVLDGDPDGNFYPDRPITRRYVARTLVKLKKYELEKGNQAAFSDVRQGDQDAAYIQTAIQNGLLFAFPDGTFRPDQPLNFGEVLRLFNNAGIIDEAESPNDQRGVTRGQWAQYLAYTPRYEQQIERLVDWEKGFNATPQRR